MQLEGLHHVTAITARAQPNVDFYVGVLGLRMVKKTVNQDAPDVYHLYYGDEVGAPGTAMTFFEFPDAAPGRHGDGMVHTVQWRVGSAASLDFWAARLEQAGRPVERGEFRGAASLRSADPEGMGIELVDAAGVPDAPLAASSPDVPAEHALQGFHGVRAFSAAPERTTRANEALGFKRLDERCWEVAGVARRAYLTYDPVPEGTRRGIQGAGSVHHVAWYSLDEDHAQWQQVAASIGLRPTPVIDRFYFESVYFRVPDGVLYELATPSPGFDVDEPRETLGEALVLPPAFEPLRARIEERLTPVTNPRAAGAA